MDLIAKSARWKLRGQLLAILLPQVCPGKPSPNHEGSVLQSDSETTLDPVTQDVCDLRPGDWQYSKASSAGGDRKNVGIQGARRLG